MAVDQSGLQSFIQNMAGTQTAAQGASPTIANNGNPNTAYNIAPLPAPTWGTYVPTTTPGQAPGQSPSTTFDYVTAPYTPSQPGYVSPFAADPTVAMVLSQMPRATGNQLLNNMLANMAQPRPVGANPSPPGLPGTPGPGTPTPPGSGTTPPPSPIGSGGSGGSRPIGPISGPVHQWITAPRPGQTVPDTTAVTNLMGRGLTREGALEWLQNTNTGRSVNDWLTANAGSINQQTGGIQRDSSLWQTIWEGIKDIPGAIGRELRTTWENATGQNGAASAVGFWGTIAGIPGARFLAEQIFPDEMIPFELSEETRNNLEQTTGELDAENMMDQWERIDQSFMDMVQTGGLSPEEIRARFPEYDQDWSAQEWADMQETMSWNNFWHGSDQARSPLGAWSGTRRPTLGLPALDNMDVFLNQMNQDNLGVSEWFRNMAGTRQQ